MSKTMTPNEIADALGKAEVYDVADCDHDFGELLLNAAATIRELEAHLKTEERGHTETLKALGEKAEALKIATEALESAKETLLIEIEALSESEHSDANASWPMLHNAEVEIEEALARIKEVG